MRSALLFLILTAGCLPQARARIRTDTTLRDHYATHALAGRTMNDVEVFFASLPEGSPRCLSLTVPCLSATYRLPNEGRGFCLTWGKALSCFNATQVDGAVLLSPAGPRAWSPTHAAVYQSLDESWPVVLAHAEATADRQVMAKTLEMSAPNSFWAQARGTVQWPTFGFQLQGGYRRWLSEYVILAVGAGYERGLFSFGRARFTQDAVLLSARFEVSSYDEERQPRWRGVPTLSGYFGFTAAVATARDSGWSSRGYVGFSCFIPLSFEVGAAIAARADSSLRVPTLYFAVGAGI